MDTLNISMGSTLFFQKINGQKKAPQDIAALSTKLFFVFI